MARFSGARTRAVVAASCLLTFAGLARAQTPPVEVTDPPPGPSTLTLSNGDVLKAPVLAEDDASVTIDHPSLGRVAIPRERIKSVAPPEMPAPPPRTIWEGWSGSVELGLSGASGNTERFGFRTGLGAERLTPKTKTSLTFAYTYGTEEGDKTEDKGELQLRNDWLPQGDSRWRPYAVGRLEYDTFQDWDWRVSAYAGIGYEFLKTEKTTLVGRVGAGASKEIGGSDNRIIPEGNLGLDFDHRFTDRQRFTFNFDLFPSLLEFGPYRFTAKAAYEVLLDPGSGLALKLGAQDDYDSTPEGQKRNDLTYFAVMMLKF